MSVRDLEEEAQRRVLGGWAGQVDDLRRAALSLWSANDGLREGELLALLSRLSLPQPVDAVSALLPAAFFGDSAVSGATTPTLDDAAVSALDGVDAKAAEGLLSAELRARALDLGSLDGLLSALAPLSRSVADMEAATSWAVNLASNSATESAALQKGVCVVWVPSRDACVRCTAYAGETSCKGSGFGGSADFQGGTTAALPFPPLHPRCRCELHEWAGDRGTVDALRREAVRSILRGYSLPSESLAVRLRAARNALSRDLQAPASVKAYARRAVDRGAYPTRSVP